MCSEARAHLQLACVLQRSSPQLLLGVPLCKWVCPTLHSQPASLCLQVLLGHPPPYPIDATPVPAVPVTPAAVLSPPLPDVRPPAAPELMPQFPSSLAPMVVAVSQSVPTQTATLLPPASASLPGAPVIAPPGPAVQLTVEPAQEVRVPVLLFILWPETMDAGRVHSVTWGLKP